MKKFMRHFGRARSLGKVAASLDLEIHPTLSKMNTSKNTALAPSLCKAIYHCDERTIFKDQVVDTTEHKTAKGKMDRQNLKTITGGLSKY